MLPAIMTDQNLLRTMAWIGTCSRQWRHALQDESIADARTGRRRSEGAAPNTVKEFLPVLIAFGHAQINAAAANYRRRVNLIAKLILREELEVLWSRLEHKH